MCRLCKTMPSKIANNKADLQTLMKKMNHKLEKFGFLSEDDKERVATLKRHADENSHWVCEDEKS